MNAVKLLFGPACNSLSPDSTNTQTSKSTSDLESEPFIAIHPENALADEVVNIQIGGIAPGQAVTLRASLKDDLDQLWESHAIFLSDENGLVDVSTQTPISGTYQHADSMGLFWSMRPNVPENEFPFFANRNTNIIPINFAMEIDGDQIATAPINRIRLPEDVSSVSLDEEGLVGQFYFPQGEGPYPTLLILGGSGGGIPSEKAIMLAAHGYATLALAYFGVHPLPEELSEIPLEYFWTAIEWLKSQEVVDENRMGVLGTSRGGELALLLGATFSDLQAVVGYVPSGVVWRNNPITPIGERSAWTYQGNPIPFTYNDGVAALKAATIPVERINGPILLISGRDDQLWPSTRLSEIAIDRLEEFNHPYPYEHLVYEDAGHLIGLPYWPTTIKQGTHPVTGLKMIFGGTVKGNAYASSDAWAHVLDFLESNLKKLSRWG